MKKFIWAGRKIKLKNLDLLQEVARDVKQINPEFDLEIISKISHKDLQEKLKNCYAVILPSFSEVCPNFILEAISFGKPFIVTQESGLKEIYNKGGIFVDPFDKMPIKQAILDMLDDTKYEQYKREVDSTHASRSWSEVAQDFIKICQ